MVISGYLEDKLNEKRRRDSAKRKAEEEKRISEAVAIAVAEAVEVARAEARASRARALAEAHQAWATWNRRRIEADERGDPFDETPPEFPQKIGEQK